jgi:competence protein ComEA
VQAALQRWLKLRAGPRRPHAAYLFVALAFVLGTGGGLLVLALTSARRAPIRAEAVVPAAVRVATTTSAPSPVMAHVAGAVVRPGVYLLGATARVADAVAAAGGARPDADLARVNLAAPVRDGTRVYLPVVGETPPAVVGQDSSAGSAGNGSAGASATGDSDAVVDLNTATPDQLDALPGVGPATAAAIVRHRATAPFTAVDDLLGVPGIGPAKLESLRARVRV